MGRDISKKTPGAFHGSAVSPPRTTSTSETRRSQRSKESDVSYPQCCQSHLWCLHQRGHPRCWLSAPAPQMQECWMIRRLVVGDIVSAEAGEG